jgi:hypothetical protein
MTVKIHLTIERYKDMPCFETIQTKEGMASMQSWQPMQALQSISILQVSLVDI